MRSEVHRLGESAVGGTWSAVSRTPPEGPEEDIGSRPGAAGLSD